jgi:lipopolysaccharide export system permease protein
MKIIYRYIIKEFLKPFFFSAAAFGFLVLLSEFFRELNFYLENKTSFLVVAYYLLLNLPWWIIQVLPVAVLLAVLFSLGQLAKSNEITAIKAAGINLWRVIILLFIMGLLIGGAELFLREKVIPATIAKAEVVRREYIRKEKGQVQSEFTNLLVALPNNGRMTVGYLNSVENVMRQIVIDYYDTEANPIQQIVAQEGYGKGTTWTLKNGVERYFTTNNGTSMLTKEISFAQKDFSVPFQAKDFIVAKLRPEQMSSKEFVNYIHQLETLGIPTTKEQIQFHLRWSSVFNHLIVMLIGIPFALGLGSRLGKFISFTFALLFAFVYWGILAIAQSLGESSVISPLLAAWMGNIIFGTLGIFLARGIKK